MVLSGCGPPRALAAARALLWPACDEHHALLLPRDIEASGNSSSPRVLIRCIMDVHNGGGNQLPEPEPEPTTATQHSGCSDDQRQQAGGVVAASPWPLLPEGVPPAHTAWPTAPGQPPLATVGAAAAAGGAADGLARHRSGSSSAAAMRPRSSSAVSLVRFGSADGSADGGAGGGDDGSPLSTTAGAARTEEQHHRSTLTVMGLKLLGEGASGKAYLVQNSIDGRSYALKCVVASSSGCTPNSLAVQNEARIHASLSHPCVVRYCYSWLDAAAANGEPTVFNLLMELCETDLWTCLEAGPPTATAAMYCGRGDGGAPAPSSGATCSIGWRECAQWSRSLVEALQYLHSQSVVHRDLNPWNVFVTVERQLKLGDFGMAVRHPVQPDASAEGLRGWETPGAEPLGASAVHSLYSAPELGSDSYGLRVDVFSAGMTLVAAWLAMCGPGPQDMDEVAGHIEAVRNAVGTAADDESSSSDVIVSSVAILLPDTMLPTFQAMVAARPIDRLTARQAAAQVTKSTERYLI
eukprot:COSAG01_NODE_3036_length_6689_cov_943.531715_1_plen_523_part_00